MRIEIIHDVLADKIFEAASIEDRSAARVQRFIRERVAYHSSDEEDFFLSEKELRYVTPYIEHIELSTIQTQFYEKSKTLVAQQQRWSKIKNYTIIGVCCTLIASTWGLWWRNKALKEQEIADHKLIELYEFSKQVEEAHNMHDFEEIRSRASAIVQEQINEQQTPIPNVTIKMLGQTIQTDNKGDFQLSLLADTHALEHQNVQIRIEHRDYITQNIEQSLENWSVEHTINIVLKMP
jgi:hypothetical protein